MSLPALLALLCFPAATFWLIDLCLPGPLRADKGGAFQVRAHWRRYAVALASALATLAVLQLLRFQRLDFSPDAWVMAGSIVAAVSPAAGNVALAVKRALRRD